MIYHEDGPLWTASIDDYTDYEWFDAEDGDEVELWVFLGEGFENNSAKMTPNEAVRVLLEMAEAIAAKYGDPSLASS